MGFPSKLERNIKILKMRFENFLISDKVRVLPNGRPAWGYRRIAKERGMPTHPRIVVICQQRSKIVAKIKKINRNA